MSDIKKQHYFLITAETATFNKVPTETNQDEIKIIKSLSNNFVGLPSKNINVNSITSIRNSVIDSYINQGLTEEMIADCIIVNISHLGLMTSDEFHPETLH